MVFHLRRKPVQQDRKLKWKHELGDQSSSQVGCYLFKVNNGNTRTMCEICSKLSIKTPERRH